MPRTLHLVMGTGPLGRSVANELVRRGEQVRMVNRSGAMPEPPPGVEIIAGDLTDPAFVRRAGRDAAVAYPCAQPPYHAWREAFPPLQEAIIEGLADCGTRLVIGENTYMYGDTDGRPLTEDLPYAATTRKGRVRAAMSRAALAAHESGRVPVAMGRGSDFFGPWVVDSAFGERVFAPALEGRTARFLGKLERPHTVTFIEDFGRALVVLGERDEAFGRAWHVPNDRPELTQARFADLLFAATGQPTDAKGTGKLLVAAAGLLDVDARETVEMMCEFEKPFVVDASAFEAQFGVRATPIESAIEKTVAWFRSHRER